MGLINKFMKTIREYLDQLDKIQGKTVLEQTHSDHVQEVINKNVLRPKWTKNDHRNGFDIKAIADEQGLSIMLYNSNGEQIGASHFEVIGDHLESFDTYVRPEMRKQGLASMMYDYAQELGNDVLPSKHQTKAGKKFWKSRKQKMATSEDHEIPVPQAVAESLAETVDVDAVHAQALREHLLKNPSLYENSQDFESMRVFLDTHRTPTPTVGNQYVYASVQSTPISNYISIAHFGLSHKLTKLDQNYAYFEIDGKIKRFPESGTLSGNALSQIYFFDSLKGFEHFETLLKLKFPNHKQTFKILDQQGVAEATGDKKFDSMIKKTTSKRAVTKQQKADSKQQASDAFKNMFGGDANDLLKGLTVKKVKETNSKPKQRLDAQCWKGKHKEGTKIKGGIRVNNCVPNESVEHDVAEGYGRYYCSTDKKWKTRQGPKQTRKKVSEIANFEQPQTRAMDRINRIKAGDQIAKCFDEILGFGDRGADFLLYTAPMFRELYSMHKTLGNMIEHAPTSTLQKVANEVSQVLTTLKKDLHEGTAKSSIFSKLPFDAQLKLAGLKQQLHKNLDPRMMQAPPVAATPATTQPTPVAKHSLADLLDKQRKLDTLIAILQKIEKLKDRARRRAGYLPPGLSADLEDYYTADDVDTDFEGMLAQYQKHLSALEQFLNMKKIVWSKPKQFAK